MADTLVIHQTLHGYRNGHELLASSLELSNEQQWSLLVATDLSGSDSDGPFDSYLTGYPLPGGGYYCLSRTWLAPEMPRPGCVWTHSILIPDGEVAQIPDYRMFQKLFRRPEIPLDTSEFIRPLNAAISALGPFVLDMDLAGETANALYGEPSRPVYLQGDHPGDHEDLALALLTQQWPRLRRAFRFSTGVLSVPDRPYDLNIVTASLARQVSVITPRTTVSRTLDLWCSAVVSELRENSPSSGLRSFLWKFGPDYPNGREAYRPLVEAFLTLLQDEPNFDRLISVVSSLSPEPADSVRLKTDLFGLRERPPVDEYRLLKSLINHPQAKSISDDIARVRERATYFTRLTFDLSLQIAIDAFGVDSDRGRQFLNGFADGLETSALESIPTPIILHVLDSQPAIATRSSFWKRSESEQLDAAHHLGDLAVVNEYLPEIIGAIVEAEAWAALRLLARRFAQPVVSALASKLESLDWDHIQTGMPVRRLMIEQGAAWTDAVINGELGPKGLKLASAALDLRSERIRSRGVAPWTQVLQSQIQLSDHAQELRSRVFLLVLGLANNSVTGAVSAIAYGFSTTYEAARNNQIPSDLWDLVEPNLPWYFAKWDRCAYMTRGVLYQIIAHSWTPHDFITIFQTGLQVEQALSELRFMFGGGSVLNALCKHSKRIEVSRPDAAAALARVCRD